MITKRYSLIELNRLVRDAIECGLPDEYWVEAELSECRERSGHCYMELIEKDEQTNTPVARASAKCWRQTWQMVSPYFERTTGQPLRAGLKVLLRVYAQFHEAYGFSWIVTDIDPTYTLGDMARKRQEIIRQLKAEGVFDLQRELRIPLFAKRIAVISAAGAAGYGDFCRQLEENDYGFRFEVTLFPAIMQGEQVEQSVIAALNQIYEQQSNHISHLSARPSGRFVPSGQRSLTSHLYRLGGNSCLSGDFMGYWQFDHELQVGEEVVFEDMIHYTTVKTNTFNGITHPAIGMLKSDGKLEILRRFGYEDYRNRMD